MSVQPLECVLDQTSVRASQFGDVPNPNDRKMQGLRYLASCFLNIFLNMPIDEQRMYEVNCAVA